MLQKQKQGVKSEHLPPFIAYYCWPIGDWPDCDSLLLDDWFNNITVVVRFRPLQCVTSQFSMSLSSCPGHPCLKPNHKDVSSAATRASYYPVGVPPDLCSSQEAPQSLNSQPECPELHHPILATSITLWKVISWVHPHGSLWWKSNLEFGQNVSSFFLVSCGQPLNSRLNHAVESVDKGERIPHPGKQLT